MRFLISAAFAALALAACGQSTAPADAPEATAAAQTVPPPWFICDAIDAPVLYLFADTPDDGHVRVVKYDKATGASLGAADLDVGEGDAGAGSIYTPLTRNGAEVAVVRQLNSGMLETPASEYTQVYSSVRYDGQDVSCRWLPRTRLMGFTGRRTIVISEDQDGDLIYTTYDFAQQAAQRPIELAENGRSTTFSLEVRDGQEQTTPQGTTFTFTAPDGHVYRVATTRGGTGTVEVLENNRVVQNEPLTAYETGEGAAD